MIESTVKKIVIIGSAYPLRGGGIATFNERLAKQFNDEGHQTIIYSFSLQYPNFLFPGKSQYSTEAAPTNLEIKSVINSINPLNWIKVGLQLKELIPDIIVVRYWIPFMGPCFGTILRIAKTNKHSKIICIADNVKPHEKRFGDHLFTKYFVKPIDAFICMSEKVLKDLKLYTSKPIELTSHPLYDNFGEIVSKQEARKHLQLQTDIPIILFFGFIRKYKGLDILIEALNILQQQNKLPNLKLLIAGEFYDEEKIYLQLIEKCNLQDKIILHTHFIQNDLVKFYFCAADFIIQPYRNATQSGVTPLAYHFEKPMLVTNVGGLSEMVTQEKVGVIAEPNANSIAEKIEELYKFGDSYFAENIKTAKKHYSWVNLTNLICKLSHQ